MHLCSHQNKRKMKDVIKASSLALLCLVAGILSPSNGFDARVEQDPAKLLKTAMIILLFTAGAILFIRRSRQQIIRK